MANENHSNNKAIGEVVISDTERFAGYNRIRHNDTSTQQTQVGSDVGSLTGNVNLTAGDKFTQTASNVLAAKDVNITAKAIDIAAAANTSSSAQDNSDLKIGTFARISSPIIDLANSIDSAKESDGRLKTMQTMAATAQGYQTVKAVTGGGSLIKGEVGIGFSSASSKDKSSGSEAIGSTINGGGNVNLTSTEGNIKATGANIDAGKTLALNSAKDIVLQAAQSTADSAGSNKSSGVEVGVGYSVGAQTGAYAYASANVGKGKYDNTAAINSNTHLSGESVVLASQGDTTLKGADVKAGTITADVGGKLAIESLQDAQTQKSQQSNVGVRAQVSLGTAWDASGNVSQSKGSGSSSAVTEQSGLFAGDGGYHVKADTIDLKGGAIASTNAQTSELSTNKLTATDLENKMNYAASSASIAGGVSGASSNSDGSKGNSIQQQNLGAASGGNVSPGLPMLEKGHDSSTTYATVTDGKITIGGVTTSSVKELGINSDAAKANGAIDALPNIKTVLKDQQAMAAAAGTVIATSRQIADDLAANAGKKLDDAQKVLNDSNSTPEQKALARQVAVDAKEAQSNWDAGGDYSRALSVVTGILVGSVAGQGGTQIAANAAAPYAAAEIGDYFKKEGNENQTLQNLSHAVLGAILASANGTNAAAGALAAGGAELAAQVLAKELYPEAHDANGVLQRDKLTPAQANNITALASGIGALLSGGAGGSVLEAAVGGRLATNAVENNFLKHADAAAMNKEFDQCSKKKLGCTDFEYMTIVRKYIAVSSANIAMVERCIKAGNVSCVKELEGNAADASELSRQLLQHEYTIFAGRADNVNHYGSVIGKYALFGPDVERAEEIAQFRKTECNGVSASACDRKVNEAVTMQKARAGILMLVSAGGPRVGAKLGQKLGSYGPKSKTVIVPPSKTDKPDYPTAPSQTGGGSTKLVLNPKTGIYEPEAASVASGAPRIATTPTTVSPATSSSTAVAVVRAPAAASPSKAVVVVRAPSATAAPSSAVAVVPVSAAVPGPSSTAADFGPQPQSPSVVATSWQGQGAYPGVDAYTDVVLPAGTLLAGSAPGQSPYYTTLTGFDKTGGTAPGFYTGLQIQPNLTNPAYPMFRNGVTIYEVNGPTNAAGGSALANPQFGTGGVDQLFIPNWENSLTPLYSIPFSKPAVAAPPAASGSSPALMLGGPAKPISTIVAESGGANTTTTPMGATSSRSQVIAKVNSGRSPYSEINGAIGEFQGYDKATNGLGHVGIQAPGKTSVPGRADYVTLDTAGDGTIYVWDAKYRGPNNSSYPKSIPVEKLDKWMSQVENSINNMPPGPAKDMAIDALKNGRVVGRVFKWPQ